MNEMKVKGIAGKSRGHWRETEMQEEGQNVKNRTGTKRERNANKGVFKQMKGAETAVKWKEAKGHARKLSGKTCKGSKIQIIPRTNRT